MDTRTRIYWTSTAITAFVLLSGGVTYLLGAESAVAGVTALGYPAYVVTLLGVWKVLGAVAVTVPGFPLLKEWAYAGVAFDLSGADRLAPRGWEPGVPRRGAAGPARDRRPVLGDPPGLAAPDRADRPTRRARPRHRVTRLLARIPRWARDTSQ